MADFTIPDPATIFTKVTEGMASGAGSWLGSFVLSTALTELGGNSTDNQLKAIQADLSTILDNQKTILSDLNDLMEQVNIASLASSSASDLAVVEQWMDTFYGIGSDGVGFDGTSTDPGLSAITDATAREKAINSFISGLNNAQVPADSVVTILENIHNLIMGDNLLVPNNQTTPGFFSVAVSSLKLAENTDTSLHDAYRFLKTYSARLYHFQYMILTMQISATFWTNASTAQQDAETQLTTFGNRILAQEALLMGQTQLLAGQTSPIKPDGLIPRYCKIFGEVLEKQGFIRAFMANTNSGPVENGTDADDQAIPVSDNGFLGITDAFANSELARQDRPIIPQALVLTDSSTRSLMRVSLVETPTQAKQPNSEVVTQIGLTVDGSTDTFGTWSSDDSTNSNWVGIQGTAFNWLLTLNSDLTAILFFGGDSKLPFIYDHKTLPTVGSVSQGGVPGFDWEYTKLLDTSADSNITGNQQLTFQFEWQEEVLAPTVPGSITFWAQTFSNVADPGVWVRGFKVRYAYSFISPIGESSLSPTVVNSPTGKNVIDGDGFLSSGGFIMPILNLPADPMGLATGYKLYRQFSTDTAFLDITDLPGVNWEPQDDGTMVVVDGSTTSPTPPST